MVNHLYTNFQSVLNYKFYDNLNIWAFEINKPDPATGYNMRMAFGFYNASDFSPPIGIERVAILKAYMIKM